jgi:fatty acid CoA ligase FadD32
MSLHNPFIKDGRITFPKNGSIVKHVERWAKVRGDKLAYRFLDYSTERDGVARDLNWADFSARNRAVGARLEQVTQPGDCVAILCPQNLDYLVAFFGVLYAGRIAVPLFDPSEPGHVGRLHAVLDDCAPSVILTTTEAAEGVRKFFRSRPAKDRPRVIAVDAVPDEVGATWVPHEDVDEGTIAYLQYTSGSTRIPTGVQITHLNLATNVVQVLESLEGEEGDRGVSWLPFPRHGPGHRAAGADVRAPLHVHDPGGVRAPSGSLDPGDGPQA